MAKNYLLFVLIFACLGVVTPQLWAEEVAAEVPDQPAPVADQEPVAEVPEAPPQGGSQGIQLFENLLVDPEINNVAGCTASYACVHGGSVNCSAPTGNCTSSGQGCGLVTCNGQTTFCPGGCNGNHWSCATFCYTTYGSMDGYCSGTRCCVCL